jgi:hypothetical protein
MAAVGDGLNSSVSMVSRIETTPRGGQMKGVGLEDEAEATWEASWGRVRQRYCPKKRDDGSSGPDGPNIALRAGTVR